MFYTKPRAVTFSAILRRNPQRGVIVSSAVVNCKLNTLHRRHDRLTSFLRKVIIAAAAAVVVTTATATTAVIGFRLTA